MGSNRIFYWAATWGASTSELFTFAQLGVKSINVTASASNINLGGGNTQTHAGSFTTTTGATGNAGTAQLAGSLLLANNNFYRHFTDDPATTAQAQALPHMQGSGAVRDIVHDERIQTISTGRNYEQRKLERWFDCAINNSEDI